MTKPKILVQLDSDPHSSVFDAVVAVDSEVDHLLQYHDVKPDQVRDLVHGAMFTRGPQDLKSTAVFVGGTSVSDGEILMERVSECFFGPMRVSVMLDANGANTTAAAAVLAAANHVDLEGSVATVLAATGSVGQRIVRLLAGEGCRVRVASRSEERAAGVCDAVRKSVPDARLESLVTTNPGQTNAAIAGSSIVFAAGAAGIELLSAKARAGASDLRVAIDLNAVPPLGIGGVEVMDKAVERDGAMCYGAVGVGGTKMKIHKAAIRRLFESNDQVLDAAEIFAIGKELAAQ